MSDKFSLYKKQVLLTLLNEKIEEMKQAEEQQKKVVEDSIMRFQFIQRELDNLHRVKSEVEAENDLEEHYDEVGDDEELQDSFDPDWSWITKARYILRMKKQGMTMGEILKNIYFLDAKLSVGMRDVNERRKHTGALSPQLNQASKRGGSLVRDTDKKKNEYVYYLAEWQDVDGGIREEYYRGD